MATYTALAGAESGYMPLGEQPATAPASESMWSNRQVRFAVIAAAFVALLVVAIAVGVTSSRGGGGDSAPPAIPEASAAVASYLSTVDAFMNASVNPCDDFYNYVCGTYVRDNLPIAQNASSGGAIAYASSSLEAKVVTGLNALFDSTHTRQLDAFFSGCMDTAAADARNWSALIAPFMAQIDAFFDLQDVFARLGDWHSRGLAQFFLFSVSALPDVRDPRAYRLTLSPEPLPLDGEDATSALRAYYALLQNAGFVDDAEQATHDLLELNLLASDTRNQVNSVVMAANLTRNLSVADFAAQYELPMADYMSALLPTRNVSQIVIYGDTYFAALGETLNNGDVAMRMIQHALKFHILYGLLDYLPYPFRNLADQLESAGVPRSPEDEDVPIPTVLASAFQPPSAVSPSLFASRDRALSGSFVRRAARLERLQRRQMTLEDVPSTHEQVCRFERARVWEPLYVSLFVQNYVPVSALHWASSLVSGLRSLVQQRLQQAQWMDDATRQVALRKLAAMTAIIGYDQSLVVDMHSLNVTGLMFEDRLAIAAFEAGLELGRVDAPVRRDIYSALTSEPLDLDVQYSYITNSILIDAGVLMAPLADPQVPMTRAAMAAIVGAQMMSAFDTSGSYFGETGAFSPWWTAATLSQWNSRGACFVAQYSAFHVGDAAVDGLATLASNAGDLAGVSLSYQLFQSDPWPQTTAQHRSSAQQFFVSFVAPACEAATNAYYVDEIEQADDVPFPFSVQGALSNLPDFARAFQCGAQSVYGRSQTNLVCSMF